MEFSVYQGLNTNKLNTKHLIIPYKKHQDKLASDRYILQYI